MKQRWNRLDDLLVRLDEVARAVEAEMATGEQRPTAAPDDHKDGDGTHTHDS